MIIWGLPPRILQYFYISYMFCTCCVLLYCFCILFTLFVFFDSGSISLRTFSVHCLHLKQKFYDKSEAVFENEQTTYGKNANRFVLCLAVNLAKCPYKLRKSHEIPCGPEPFLSVTATPKQLRDLTEF